MHRLILFSVAMTLVIIATLVFMAGNQMGMLSGNQTRLIGTGVFMFSGLFWCLYALTYKDADDSETSQPK